MVGYNQKIISALNQFYYYKNIFDTYLFQLVEQASTVETDPIVIQNAHALSRHFIKRKLNLIFAPRQTDITGTLFDPHHHFNSTYISQDEELRLLLPNFNSIYEALRTKDKPHEVEHAFVNEDQIKDVQSFGFPPRKTNDSKNRQTVFNTRGYARGGWPISIHHNCTSVDYCGLEKKYDAKDVSTYLSLALTNNARLIRFHMGETVIPLQGKENVERLLDYLDSRRAELANKIIRIGHGTHMGIDSMVVCATKGYFVECCLSSNKETGILEKRHQYPLAIMLLLGIQVTIGTDGGKIYYTDLKQEYSYAEKNIARFIQKIVSASQEEITLLNGDKLLFKHVKHLFVGCGLPYDDNQPITYTDLGHVKQIESILSTKILLVNMQRLQQHVVGEPCKNPVEKKAVPVSIVPVPIVPIVPIVPVPVPVPVPTPEQVKKTSSARVSLAILNFNKLLLELESKAQRLSIDGHPKMAKSAADLCLFLKNAAVAQFALPDNDATAAFPVFKKKCLNEIDDVCKGLEELQYHGLKKLLGNLALAIIGLGVLYLVAAGINYFHTKGKHFFFQFEPATTTMLHHLKCALEETGPGSAAASPA